MQLDWKDMCRQVPVLEDLAAARETVWTNPALLPAQEALASLPLTMDDVDDAEARLARFAPFIEAAFPETAPQGGEAGFHGVIDLPPLPVHLLIVVCLHSAAPPCRPAGPAADLFRPLYPLSLPLARGGGFTSPARI